MEHVILSDQTPKTAVHNPETPPAKSTKTGSEPDLMAASVRKVGDRYSISHAVFDAVRIDHLDATVPAVFQNVHAWFEARNQKAGCHTLDVRTKFVQGQPVIYGWPRGGHPRRRVFAGTVYADQLMRFVCQTMWPSPDVAETTINGVANASSINGATDEVATSSAISSVTTHRIADIFQPSLLPILSEPWYISVASFSRNILCTEEQQESDIHQLCQFAGVDRSQWPTQPTTDIVPHFPDWSRFTPKTRRRVKCMVTALGWTDPVGVGYYMLVVFAK